MSDAEKLIEVLGVIAIVLIVILMGVVLFAIFMKKNNEKKKEAIEKGISPENEQSNKTVYNTKSIFNFMDFERIEDNMIIQKRGKYLMVLECQGINYDLMSEMERTSVEQGFIQFLNTLNTEIQIYVQTRTINLEDSILTYKNKFKMESKSF